MELYFAASIGFLLALAFIFSKILHDYLYILIRMFLLYTVLSVLVIGAFTFIYAYGILDSRERSDEGQISCDVEGVNIYLMDGDELLVDMCYFSSMTYFTVGFGDIYLTNGLRKYVILEAFLGYTVLGIVLTTSLSMFMANSNSFNILSTKLSTGSRLLSIREIAPSEFSIVYEAKSKTHNCQVSLKKSEYNFLKEFEYDVDEFISSEDTFPLLALLNVLRNECYVITIRGRRNLELKSLIEKMETKSVDVNYKEIITTLDNLEYNKRNTKILGIVNSIKINYK